MLAVVSYNTNRSFLIWGLFVIFALLVVPRSRGRSFLFSFVPYAAVWFVFTAARSLADETLLARTLNLRVAQLERWLFGGQLPSQILQDRLFDSTHPIQLNWYDYLTTGIHWSYFLVPHAVAIRIWYINPVLFRQYLSTMTLLLVNGLCVYFLIPANPPWMAPEACDSPMCPSPERIMATVGKQLGGGIYNASYRVIGESNAIAAMPSIHMAITFLIVFPAFHAGKRWGIAALAYNALMGYSLIYLGEHYFVDIVAGCAITTYAWYTASIWYRKVAPAMSQRFSPAQAIQPSGEVAGSPG